MQWIDTYQRPSDYLVHNAGMQFASAEFRQYTESISISIKEVPVEAHHSIGKIERYHVPVCCAYEIIKEELAGETISKEMVLQIVFKTVNDSAGPNRIVLTLLVFGLYSRMTDLDSLALSVTKRAYTIHKATEKVQQIYTEHQLSDALAI